MRRFVFAGILMVCIAGAAVYYVRGAFHVTVSPAAVPSISSVTELPGTAPTPVAEVQTAYAVPRESNYRIGMLPKGFPRYLLPAPAIATVSARSVAFSPDSQQMTASYRIAMTQDALRAFTVAALRANGWSIAYQESFGETVGIRATQGKKYCHATLFSDGGTKARVSLTCGE